MDTTCALIALAAIAVAFTIYTILAFARIIGEPADEPCSDFTEPHRACGPWCCRGRE